MSNYNTSLQANNTKLGNSNIDLQSLIEQANNLPDAGAEDPVLQDKTVSPTTSQQVVNADEGYDGLDTVIVKAIPTAEQATINVNINSSGLITANANQTEGYVEGGMLFATKQLTTQAAKTVTPTKAFQTAVDSETYTTGAITIAPIPEEYITTTDATATADKIFQDETAYVNGEKITGNFTIANELSAQDNLITQIQSALEGKAASGGSVEIILQDKTISPTTYKQVVSADGGYDGLNTVTVESMPVIEQAIPSVSVNASGLITATVNQAEGYVEEGTKTATKQLTTQSAKTITPSTSEQTAVAGGVYTTGDIKVAAMPTAEQATPSINISSSGLITASSTQSAGYVNAGTKSDTKQLTTQGAKTITPSTESQTAVASGVYTTGAITVAPIPSDYVIPSGTLEIATNGTHDVKSYANVNVSVLNGEGDVTLNNLINNKILSNSEWTNINTDLCRGWQYIVKVDLPNVVTTSTSGYFCYGCTRLEEVNMPKCTTIGNYSFYNNTALKAIDFPSLTAVTSNCFRQCTAATSVNLPVCTSIAANAFQKDALIEKMDFPLVGSIAATAFDQCSALTAVILRKNAVCTLANVSAFNNTPIKSGTGYIYVPSSLVDSYKGATNWSTYANQIRAIEDYPDICGT